MLCLVDTGCHASLVSKRIFGEYLNTFKTNAWTVTPTKEIFVVS